MQILTFSNKGTEVQKTNLTENHPQFQEAIEARNVFVENLSEFNDEVAEFVIENNSYEVPIDLIEKSLKSTVLESKALVTFCGSAFKNVGVQPLLDAINLYLPNPKDIKHDFLVNLKPRDLCAMAYKIVHHPNKVCTWFHEKKKNHQFHDLFSRVF